ncbi:MAG: glycosyltransferase family 39 protein [Planctomycetes bacterium]|nr:glycosyltransferase family 39 protein [Planctomycetota bacterium]
MNRGAWVGVTAVLAARGGVEVWRAVRMRFREKAEGGWLLVVVASFVALALLAASLPPGVLWPTEGNGYDVLEYHLGALRDFQDAGRIAYLPHNIYSNFPFGVEMLYLLGMILRGDPLRAAFTAQMLHAILGILAGVATWCAARAALCDAEPARRNSAHIAGIVAVSCPIVMYVGALAYVENGLILFTALALWAIFEAMRRDQQRPMRWFAMAGAMAGFAFGCKYIAAAQVVIPLALAVAWVGRRIGATRSLAAFGLAAAVTMSPWLIRNAVNTGNPVFPLARTAFAEKAGIWNDDGAARWAEGHLPGPEHRSVGGRIERLWNQVIWNPLYGPVMGLGILAAMVGVLRRRNEAVVPCVLLLAGTLVTWIGFTHLVDRFAMVALVPASVLIAVVIGAAIPPMTRPLFAVSMAAVGLLLMVFTNFDMIKLLVARDSVGIKWFTDGEWPTHQHVPKLNEIVRGGGKVLMVADARRYYLDRGVDYCVVFNRNPFAEAAERMSPGELIAWLREQGYTYVFVNWSEMARLRGSRYGFWKSVDGELFKGMMDAGLAVTSQFAFDQDRAPYGTLFAVPLK